MLDRRWSRYLPDRSHLLWLTGILVVLFMAVEFIQLTVTRNRLAAQLQQEEVRYRNAVAQMEQLRDLLPILQQNQHVPSQAYQDFGLVLPGTLVVEPQQSVEFPVAPARPAEPFGWLRLPGR